MIKSLSPYYITIPLLSPYTGAVAISYTLYIYVWNGLASALPTTAVYSITKKNIGSSVGNDRVNISRLVNDYINFTPNTGTVTGLYDGNNQQWIRTQVVYNTVNINDLNRFQLSETNLMIKGYGYGNEGENPQPPSNRILLTGTEFKVGKNSFFNLPIYVPTPDYSPLDYSATDYSTT